MAAASIAVGAWIGVVAAVHAVETLELNRHLDSGTTQTSSGAFSTVGSVVNTASNTSDVVVLASFSGSPAGGGQGIARGEWRLVSGAQQSTVISRDMSDSSSDFGIINLAWTFENLAPGASVDLQHRALDSKTIRTSRVTLVTIPMTTASGVGLVHGDDSQCDPGGTDCPFSFPTTSTGFVPVKKSDSTPLDVRIQAFSQEASSTGAVFIAAVAGTSAGAAEKGSWKLEYNPISSPPATPCQDGTVVGTVIERSLSGTDDLGAVMLYAIAEGLADGAYDIRLCARSGTGVSVSTSNAALSAFSLAYGGGAAGGYFPHIQTTVASTQSSNASMDWLPGLLEGFNIASAGPFGMFLGLSSTLFTQAAGAGDFVEMETCIQNSLGASVFGKDNNGNSQEVRRFFSQANDLGAGGQVGLALGLSPNTDYDARGCAAITGNPVTFQDPNLVGFVTVSTDATTTPVTLSRFRAVGAGTVAFEWSTATEVANVGFNLYAVEPDRLRKLNEGLIPSQAMNTLDPQQYRFEAFGVESESFLLEDVDVFGSSRFHGPFALDRAYGIEGQQALEPTDWPGIRRAHAASRELRRKAPRVRRSPDAAFPEVNLLVDRDGIHRVSFEQLLAAGFDLSGAPPRELALFNRGRPVPIHVAAKGSFGPGAHLEFIGRGLRTLYTRTNVYTLRVDRKGALRVASDRQPVKPWAKVPAHYLETMTVERDRAYNLTSPTEDPWFDTRLLATSSPVEAAFELDLEGYVPGAAPVELEVDLWGGLESTQDPDHHVIVEVNGHQVADEWFDGRIGYTIRAELPGWLLRPGSNTLLLRLPRDTGAPWDRVHYDRYRITYPRRFALRGGALDFVARGEAFRVEGLASTDAAVYRVTDGMPERLTHIRVEGRPGAFGLTWPGSAESATYYISTAEALLTPALEKTLRPEPITEGEARLVIVSHPDFLEGLAPLVAARRQQGLSVRLVDVEQIYAQFSAGIFEPEAIRRYLAHAHENMGTRYVLLVGGDTYDYLDHLGRGSISFIPTLYAQTDRIVRHAPVDPLYGDIDGDELPELTVGRFPVRTAEELAVVVEKTLEFEARGLDSAVLAADAFDLAADYSFTDASEAMAALLPAGLPIERAYVDELGLSGARERLLREMNQGTALTSYFGHSGPTSWSFQRLFEASDARALENGGRPGIVTQWGCWNTYHVTPSYNTLGHELLLRDNRGAAAVLGAATLTLAQSEAELGRRLFANFSRPGMRLGDVVLEAKRALAEVAPERRDVLLGWTLLGDPTLALEP